MANAKRLEFDMWDTVLNNNIKAFRNMVAENAVMICKGGRYTGHEYAEFIKNFDINHYEFLNFEVVYADEETIQVYYLIETESDDTERNDLNGEFNVTSTWKKVDGSWILVFNMHSRIIK